METTRLNVPTDFAPFISAALHDSVYRGLVYSATFYHSGTYNEDTFMFTAREVRTNLLRKIWCEVPFYQHELCRTTLVHIVNALEKITQGIWHVPECLFPYYALNPNAWLELPHTANKDQTKIATFKNVDSIFRDIQTVQKPAKWFKEFAKGSDVAASEFNNAFLNSIVKPPVFWSLRELGRHDTEGWIWVYRNTQGTGSCMAGERATCTQVYAHPENELDLVFTTRDNVPPFDPSAIVNSRSIFDMRDNEFVRVYSDTHLAHHAFLAYIDAKGSKEVRQLNEGHKLLRIAHPYGDNKYYMPYLDGIGQVTDEGDHFTSGGDIDASNTSGWCTVTGQCPCCGGSLQYSVWINSEEQDVCEDCAGTDYFYCELSGEHYNEGTHNRVDIVTRWGGTDVAEEGTAEYEGYQECEAGRYLGYYLHPMVAVEDHAGSIIFHEEAVYCELDGNYYHEDDLHNMPTEDNEEDTPEA